MPPSDHPTSLDIVYTKMEATDTCLCPGRECSLVAINSALPPSLLRLAWRLVGIERKASDYLFYSSLLLVHFFMHLNIAHLAFICEERSSTKNWTISSQPSVLSPNFFFPHIASWISCMSSNGNANMLLLWLTYIPYTWKNHVQFSMLPLNRVTM